MPRIVAFNVETPNRRNDRICSIGITIIDNTEITGSLYYLVNPECEFDDINISIHGIYTKDVADAPTFPEVWAEVGELFRSNLVAAHNTTFDLCVLKKVLAYYGIDETILYYVCTKMIATKEGINVEDHILARHLNAKILYLTTFADDDYIIKALKLGAKGYILKQDFESIVPSLKTVYAGQSVFGDDIIAKIPSLLSEERGKGMESYGITGKEAEIIRLVADGLSNREVATELFLCEGTVRNSISVIMDKLDFKRRTQLAIFYYKNVR